MPLAIRFFVVNFSELSRDESTTILDTTTIGEPLFQLFQLWGCNIVGFFAPQQLILDLTPAGLVSFRLEYRGRFIQQANPMVFNETCQGLCYNDFIGPPSRYDNVYFEINSLVYQTNDDTTITNASTALGSISSGPKFSSGTGSTETGRGHSSARSGSPGSNPASSFGMSVTLASLLGGCVGCIDFTLGYNQVLDCFYPVNNFESGGKHNHEA